MPHYKLKSLEKEKKGKIPSPPLELDVPTELPLPYSGIYRQLPLHSFPLSIFNITKFLDHHTPPEYNEYNEYVLVG